MPPLTVPEAGLTLLGSPTPTPESKNESKPLQIMQLDLADGVLEEIVKCARHGGKSMNVSFGKTIVKHPQYPIPAPFHLTDVLSIDTSLWEQVSEAHINSIFFSLPPLRLSYPKRNRPRSRRTNEPQTRHAKSQRGDCRCRRGSHQVAEPIGLTRESQTVHAVSVPPSTSSLHANVLW